MKKDKIQPIIELYSCIQGEGKYIGIPHILIRFSGCPLRCQFSGSLCDTLYASWNAEKGKYSLKDIEDFYKGYRNIRYTMITGGSPTMHSELLKEVVNIAKENNHFVTIETEGSYFVETNADFISLSPKLSNSKPLLTKVPQSMLTRHEKYRTNYTEMNLMLSLHNDYQVKYVISNKNDLKEVYDINKILRVPKEKVYLMAEGVISEAINDRAKWITEICIKEGFNYSPRLHIDIFGNKRGV